MHCKPTDQSKNNLQHLKAHFFKASQENPDLAATAAVI